MLAPAGHGKTHQVIERIRALHMAEPLAPVLVVLPNQLQMAEFRRRLAQAGGALGVELATFYFLYSQLLARSGHPLPCLPDPVQVRLLRAIVDDLYQKQTLHYYAALRARPGFVLILRDLLQELKRARISPEDFAIAVRGLGPRLEELAAVYTAYQSWLRQGGWADPEGQGWLAALALEQDANLGRHLRLLVVDGFDEFNPTQLGVLALLVKRAQETLLTFTGDANRQRPAHRRFARGQQMIAAALPGRFVWQADVQNPRVAPALAALEANLFDGVPLKIDARPSLEMVEAQTRPDEARAVLRWVKARLVQDGLHPEDVAILARDIEAYRPFLEEVAAEFGLPLRVMGGLPLGENPAVAALMALLSLPAEDWPRRKLVEAWRSPYFDWTAQGIAPGAAAALDSLSRDGRVIAGLAQWREAFDLRQKQNVTPDAVIDEDDLPMMQENRAGINDLRAGFDAFIEWLTPPPQASVHDYVAYIEGLIGDDPALATRFQRDDAAGDASLRVVARARQNDATAERDVAALRALKDVLRGLALAEAVLGTSPSDYAIFYQDLNAAVKAASYSSTSKNGVLAASVAGARGMSFSAVALMGLSEGEFPRLEKEDILLRESDRESLRERGVVLESKLTGDEISFFYQAVTRARQRLLLTRPYLADDGQAWEPSPYWQEVRRLVGDLQPRRSRPEDPLLPDEAASPGEFVRAAARFDLDMGRGLAALQARMGRTAQGVFDGDVSALDESLAAHFSTEHAWSASRLEAYGTCPFYFYIAYALDLHQRTPPEEGYDVRILGSMLHKILEEVYRQAANPDHLDECLALLPGIAGAVFAAAPAEYGFRPTPLWALQQQELLRVLQQTITALAEASNGYTPRYLEQRFGMGAPSLVLRTPAGDVRLHGYIDRLDEGADGRLRVMDYKAGSAAIRPVDLAEGRRLQLPIYALAAQDALGLGEIGGGFYWHIQRAEASALKLEKYEGGLQATFEAAREHIGHHVANIRSGQFQPGSPADGCPSYCPASQFCWRYRSRGY